MDFKQKQRNNFKYRDKLIKKPTKEELIVKSWLDKQGYKYIFQKGFLKPFHRIVDFYIPKKKIIIEVDGLYHEYIRDKDLMKDKSYLKKRRMRTIRINNEQVMSGEYIDILSTML